MTEAVQKIIYPRYAIIRIRGIPTTPRDIAATLDLLRLRRKYTMVVVPGTPDIMGMIERANDWITWGEIDADTLAEVLRKRGRIAGDKPLYARVSPEMGVAVLRGGGLGVCAGED